MKKLIILLLLIALFTSSYAQQSVKREIITFDYFKMERPDSARFEALLSYDIVYYYNFIRKSNNLSFDFKVNARFYPEKSYFSNIRKYKDNTLLKHEQGHADIVVLYARKLLLKLKSSSFTITDYKKRIDDFSKEYWRLALIEQNLYDAETSHGVNKACQEIWNQKFDAAFKQP